MQGKLLTESKVMNKYYVKMSVHFNAEIEAESKEAAEEMAWTGWGESSDSFITYDGVDYINVEDMGEICEDCNEVQDQCDCEDEEEGEDE